MKVVIEIAGRETRTVTREVIVEVPDGTTADEINALNADAICSVLNNDEWTYADTDGVDPDDVSYVEEAYEEEHADCRMVTTGEGELQLVPNNSDRPAKYLCDCQEGRRPWSCQKCGQKLLICDDCRTTTVVYCAEC